MKKASKVFGVSASLPNFSGKGKKKQSANFLNFSSTASVQNDITLRVVPASSEDTSTSQELLRQSRTEPKDLRSPNNHGTAMSTRSSSGWDTQGTVGTEASIATFCSPLQARHPLGPEGKLSISDLVDNECAKILQKPEQSDLQRPADDSMVIANPSLNWHDAVNRDKLLWARMLTRQLFHAFKSEKKSGLGISGDNSRCAMRVQKLLVHRYMALVSMICTLHALVAADVGALAGKRAKYTLELACINTAVLAFFIFESLLHFMGVRGYVCSPQFCVDMFALMSLVGDTWIGYELLRDGAASGRAARVLRMLRMGGRSSRFVRMVKNVRLVQALRIMPRVWHFLNTQRRGLRVMIFHERLYRLFQCIDEGDKAYLNSDEVQIFHMSLALEFPTEVQKSFDIRSDSAEMSRDVSETSLSAASFSRQISDYASESSHKFKERVSKISRACATIKDVSGDALQKVSDSLLSGSSRPWAPAWARRWLPSKKVHHPLSYEGHHDFEMLLEEIMYSPVSKLLMDACEQDLQRVEGSFSLVHEAGGKLTLKVSTIVLIVLVVLPMLEMQFRDRADVQMLVHLSHLVDLTGALPDCTFVRGYARKTKHKLLVVALNMTTYFTPDCECCATCCRSTVQSIRELSRTWEKWTGLQPHELQSWCYPEYDCDVGEPRSLALFDVHERIRHEALLSLIYTTLVVILLIIFVLFFTSDLRLFNERVLNPLWDLLDDMTAMKTVEFARANDLTQLGTHRQSVEKIMRRHQSVMDRATTCFMHCLERHPDLEEMVTLKRSFTIFRNTLRNWTKYVPIALVKKIVQSGIEVQLGVTHREVTVLFLDINGFDDLCKGLEPREVLIVLSGIIQQVSHVLERFQGTLLEFIGDEMMCVFNAPAEVPKHSTMALNAAADCLDQLAKLKSMSLRARIGVHTAKVLAGHIGSPMRLKYGLLGDGVNMTARLKSLNSQLGTRCLVSSTTLEHAENIDEIVRRPLGRYILKGRTTPTEVWEVLGRRPSLPAPILRAADQHTKGFSLFLARDFKGARANFAEAYWIIENQRKGENDKPSRHLLRRCDACIKEPPPEDWDGSEKLAKK